MNLSLAALVHHLGAIGVGLGAGLEGESAVVLGGIAAHHGFFSPIASALAAWVGSTIADQSFFLFGRWRRDSRWVRKVAEKRAFARALELIQRHPIAFCMAFRFVYGFRIAGPVAIGVSQIRARLFVILNVISAGIWAATFTAIGYFFGHAAEQFLRRVFSPTNIALIALAGVVVLLIGLVWRRRHLAGE